MAMALLVAHSSAAALWALPAYAEESPSTSPSRAQSPAPAAPDRSRSAPDGSRSATDGARSAADGVRQSSSAEAASADASGHGVDPLENATRLFGEGSELAAAGSFEAALVLFQESYRLAPSPNSQFMIGSMLAQLGRDAEAARILFSAADAARLKAVSEPRYTETANAASAELARIRPSLAHLRVRVLGRTMGAVLRVAGAEVPIDPGGETHVFRAPGEVQLTLVFGAGPGATQTVTVAAGQEELVTFSATDGSTDGAGTRSEWKLYGAVAAGGVGVVGLGLFAGFGANSRGIYGDLEARCAPHCGPADRAEADRGEAHATVANAMLGVGLVGLAAGGTLFALHLEDGTREPARASAALVGGPGWLGVAGRF
ncbi:MAG: hypothetical protein EXR75_01560 [Myxococcales bacterium]|nr:hypothetical protein [Myxococcales bacterium]